MDHVRQEKGLADRKSLPGHREVERDFTSPETHCLLRQTDVI